MADQFDKGFDPKPKTVRFTMKPGVFARELRGSMSPFNPRENESSEEAGHGAPVQNPTQDFGGIFGTEAPPVLNGFSGANMSNSIPPDPTIAAGPTTVMIAVNSKVYVMNLNGGLLASENFSDVIPSPHNLFDPWIEYDRYSNRFICVVDCKSSDDLVSECWVVFSDDSSGLGGWTAVALNMRLDGNTQVNYWMDYPRLALTDSSVCVGGPMFPINSGSVYSKLRFLSKADLYNGGSLTWADAHHQTSGGVPDTHVVPATNWDSSGSFYAVSAKTGGSDEIVIREFADTATNFGASTTLLNTYILPVTPYDNPPDARQPGGPRLENLDCRISQANVADGDIFAIHTVKVVEPGGFGSGIKAYKIRPVTGQAPRVILDSTLSSSGEDSFYPGIRGTKDGAAVIGFCRSGPSTYASQRVTGFKFGATQIESSALLKDGTATYEVTFGGTRNRFGDYSGVAVSPADEQTAWIHGEVALVSNSWRTWVASAKYDHYQLVTTPDVTGNQGEAVLLSATVRSSYNDITVSGTSVTFKVDGVVVGTDATNASGIAYLSFSIGSLAGGNHTITATASSTSIFDPGEATANLFVRNPVTIVVPDRTATIGNSVSLRATVARTETGSPVASELVTFRVGGSVVGTDQTDASGIATLDWTVTSAVPGDVPITAAIEGDTTLAPSSGTGNLRRQSDVNFVLDNVSGQRTSTIRFRATLTRTYDGQALANRPVRFEIAGTPYPETTNSNGVATLDYVVPASASFGSGHTIAVYFDGEDFYTAGSKSAPWTVLRPTFRGNANFLDWSASQVGLPLSLIVRNSAGATVQGPTTVLCGNGGTWSLDTTLAAGDYSVSMKGSHWLRKQSALTALNSTTGTGNINLSLKNGDATPDNVIDLSDYTKVVVAFNALPSTGNWDESADLNGDDVIDLTDYTIVVTNFNLVGDL